MCCVFINPNGTVVNATLNGAICSQVKNLFGLLCFIVRTSGYTVGCYISQAVCFSVLFVNRDGRCHCNNDVNVTHINEVA